MTQNTLLQYYYRDSGNNKAHSEDIVFVGQLTDKQKQMILDNFQDLSGFIPSQMGLEDLQGELISHDSMDHDEDSCFHWVDVVEDTYYEPTTTVTAQQFYDKIMNTTWDGTKSNY